MITDEMNAESGLYCQKFIGKWNDSDAKAALGEPTSQRDSLDQDHVANGRIIAFADPTGRYEQLELDFDHQTGLLRSVYAYPKGLSWTQCHHVWAGKVNASLAKKGRRFYSYIDRKLDVLVDAAGQVISLGWY